MDFRNRTVAMAYGKNGAFKDNLPQYTDTLTSNLSKYKSFLGEQKWFAGDELTACDFVMYELLDQNNAMVPGVLEGFPTLQSYCDRFRAIPAIQSYLASDECITFPCNNQHSQTTQQQIC